MCLITSTRCPKCSVINETAITPCKRFLDPLDAALTTHQNYGAGESILVHCKNFIWPPVRPVPMLEQLCDKCTFLYRPEDYVVSNWGPDIEVKGFNDAGEMEDWVKCCESNSHWPARLSEAAHRELTLRIPCCNLCKKPRFYAKDKQDSADNNDVLGIEGIQLQVNSVLWKWMFLIRRKQPISIRLSTGFSIQPCRQCIDLECVLRGKVMKYLEMCDEKEAWEMWHWLTMRILPQTDFFQNKSTLSEFPYTSRPDNRSFSAIMTAGWKARTGVDFADAILSVDGHVDHYDFPFIQHKVPFLDLTQWNELAGVSQRPVPSAELPALPPLDLDTYQIEYELPDSVIEEADEQQLQELSVKVGEKRKADGDMVMVKPAKKLHHVQFAETILYD
ncbi:hypothetical protein F5Y06DRAFT_68809 [Hypoxylon sp. FL0890]|nr:hypothetical protein F5Y06DRAFT_68809 [Hypoxylon sp. FL0890]